MSRHKQADDYEQVKRDSVRDAIVRAKEPITQPEVKMHKMNEETKKCYKCGMDAIQIAFSGKGCAE